MTTGTTQAHDTVWWRYMYIPRQHLVHFHALNEHVDISYGFIVSMVVQLISVMLNKKVSFHTLYLRQRLKCRQRGMHNTASHLRMVSTH